MDLKDAQKQCRTSFSSQVYTPSVCTVTERIISTHPIHMFMFSHSKDSSVAMVIIQPWPNWIVCAGRRQPWSLFVSNRLSTMYFVLHKDAVSSDGYWSITPNSIPTRKCCCARVLFVCICVMTNIFYSFYILFILNGCQVKIVSMIVSQHAFQSEKLKKNTFLFFEFRKVFRYIDA